MSILDSFYILFKTGDAKEAKRDIKGVEDASDAASRKLDLMDKANKAVGSSFVELADSAVKVGAAFLGFSALKTGVDEAARMNAELDKLSKITGASVEDLSAWNGAIQSIGGGAEDLSITMSSLFDKYSQSGFAGNIKNVTGNMLELSDKFREMESRYPGSAYTYGSQAGLSKETVLLLLQGREEVTKLLEKNKDLNGTNKQAAELARLYVTEVQNIDKAYHGLYTTVGTEIFPVFAKTSESVQDFMGSLRDNEESLHRVLGIIVAFASSGAVIALVAAFGALGWAGTAVAATLVAVGMALAFVYDHWKDIKGEAAAIGDFFSSKWAKLFGGNSSVPMAQSQLLSATTSTLGVGGTGVFNEGAKKNISVVTGPITVSTQATSADDIAAEIGKSLNSQVKQVINNSDDGIAY